MTATRRIRWMGGLSKQGDLGKVGRQVEMRIGLDRQQDLNLPILAPEKFGGIFDGIKLCFKNYC